MIWEVPIVHNPMGSYDTESIFLLRFELAHKGCSCFIDILVLSSGVYEEWEGSYEEKEEE